MRRYPRNHGLIITSLLAILFACVFSCYQQREETGGIHVLFLMPRTLGANNFLIRDVFDEFGWHVVKTSVGDAVMPCVFWGRYAEALPVIPDISLSEIGDITEYDCLFLPTGPGNAWQVPNSYEDILKSKEALELISDAAQAGLAVFGMCSGVRVFAAADVIRGRNVVGSPRFKEEYASAGATYLGNENNDSAPCIDGRIVTGARGQTYNYSIGYAVATVIERGLETGPKHLSAEHVQVRDLNVESGTVWSRAYGGAGSDGGRALCATPDGGFIIAGYTFAPGARDADLMVIKTDAEGRLVWKRTYGGAGTEYGNGCTVQEDGLLVTGYTTSFGAGGKDVYLLKLGHDGQELWARTFGGPGEDVGMSVCTASTGHAYVCGFTDSYGAGEEDVYLVKVDAGGDEVWMQTYGGKRIDVGAAVDATDDGGCAFAASSLSHGGKNTDFWLARIDSDGGMVWNRACGANPKPGHGFDWCKAGRTTGDGGMIAVGYSDTNDLMDLVVVKTDERGHQQWLKTFGNQPFYDYGTAVIETRDGGFVLVGVSKSMREAAYKGEPVYDNDWTVIKLNAAGDCVWEKKLDASCHDWACAVLETEHGSYMVLGHSLNPATGSLDMALLNLGNGN